MVILLLMFPIFVIAVQWSDVNLQMAVNKFNYFDTRSLLSLNVFILWNQVLHKIFDSRWEVSSAYMKAI